MTKSKQIIFRVSDEVFTQIEKAASASGKNPNDWCRDLALAELGLEAAMTANERIIFEELAKARYLLGIGFGLLATSELTKTAWDETKSQVDSYGEKIAEQLLARRKNTR